MELSANAEKLISKADNWTFAGDCSLLQWMKEIAENLEQRATTTTQTFDQFSTNLKRTTTALDNATNSLAALQYTQFVENRCHDDDETIANVAEVPVNIENNNQPTEDTSKLWTIFMKKNFEVLNNCHERFSLDFEDSDEEDNTTNNFIYQAKNPYNERLLPHIYGSNLWKENWHVGLCDGNNEYSGDEISEAFSESSSITSPEENESYESTAANLSEWASSTSITTEKQPPHLKIQNASSLRGSQPLFPEDNIQRVTKIAAGSDTSSSTSRNTPNNIKTGFEQNHPRYDLFAPIQDIPPTSSSSSSSLHQQFSSSAQSNTNTNKDFLNANEERSQNVGVTVPSSTSTNPIRRRPVNLFDDDDFNNFMTEIVDKVNQKEEPIVPPVPAARQQSSTNGVIKTKEKQINAPVNLFDEQSSSSVEHITAKVQESPKPRSAIAKGEPTKKKTLNLFDDNIDLFLPKADIPATVTQVPPIDVKNDMHPKLTAKSLFDDEDEEDDFLNIFGSKKLSTPKSIEKTLLFNDSAEEDFKKSETDLSKNKLMSSSPIRTVDLFKETTPLFNDTEEVKEINTVFDRKITENILNQQDEDIPKQNDMSDVQSRADKLVVSSEFSENETIATEKRNKDTLLDEVEINASKKSLLSQKKLSLFDDGSESDDDDIFGNLVKVIKPLAPKKDKLFADVTNDVVLESSKIDTTKESEKNNSTNYNAVHTSKLIEEEISENQDFIDDSTQHVTAKEFKNIEDECSHPVASLNFTEQTPSHVIEVASANKTPNVLADNFERFGESLEKDFKVLDYSEKVHETAEKVNEIVQPLSDAVYETVQPIDADPVREIAKPPVDEKVMDTEQLLNDENNTESTNITSTLENKTPNLYASLFLDEPPDDDDTFFQSLDNSSLLSSKSSHDLDADFYEPALPKTPTDVTNTSKTTIVAPIYNSVGLFSDIPPDDDLEDFSFNSNSTSNSELTKRIHSVFYDDFKETIAAVNKKTIEVSTNIHSMFNDEPPSDNDDTDFATKLQSSDKRKIDKNTDFSNDIDKPISQDVLDEAKTSVTADLAVDLLRNIKVKSNSSVSKLQMPKININVQALLPPSAKKATLEEPTHSQLAGKENLPILNNSFNSPTTLASSASASNQNILVNVCKNRVRAPVKRRPSSRRARQENYRKSLIAEQDDEVDNEVEFSSKQTLENLTGGEQAANVQGQHLFPTQINTPETPNSFFKISNDYTDSSSGTLSSYPSETIEKPTNAHIIPKTANIIKESLKNDEDADFSLSKKNQSKVATLREEESKTFLVKKPTKSSPLVDKPLEEDHKSKNTRQGESISESKMPKTAKNKDSQKASFFDGNDLDVSKKLTQKEIPAKSLFADESESDSDELFGTKKPLQTKNTSSMAKVVKTKKEHSIVKSSTLFSSDDDDNEVIDKFEKKQETTKTFSKKSAVKADVLFSDTDDDDDLFGSKTNTKAAVSKSNVQHAKPAKNSLSGKLEPPATKSTLKTTKTADNPLADLLNN